MKKGVFMFFMIFLAGATCGCASKVAKNWESAGGSRADAVVVIGYMYNPVFEIPVLSEDQARKTAEERCSFWGVSEG